MHALPTGWHKPMEGLLSRYPRTPNREDWTAVSQNTASQGRCKSVKLGVGGLRIASKQLALQAELQRFDDERLSVTNLTFLPNQPTSYHQD